MFVCAIPCSVLSLVLLPFSFCCIVFIGSVSPTTVTIIFVTLILLFYKYIYIFIWQLWRHIVHNKRRRKETVHIHHVCAEVYVP